MESGTFQQAIFVRDGFDLRKIECVMDAIEFLEEWPVERRGLLHAAASETLFRLGRPEVRRGGAQDLYHWGPQGRGDGVCPRGAGMDDGTEDR